MNKSKFIEEAIFYIEWILEILWAFRLMIAIIIFGVFYSAQSALVATLGLMVLYPFLFMLVQIFRSPSE